MANRRLFAVLGSMILIVTVPPSPAWAAPTLTVTVNQFNYVDGGPITPTTTITGVTSGTTGTLAFRRYPDNNCTGSPYKPFGSRSVTGNVTYQGPDLNDGFLGKHSLRVVYSSSSSTITKCVPYWVQQHSEVALTLPKTRYEPGQLLNPSVTLQNVTADAGGKATAFRFDKTNCAPGGTGSSKVTNVVNGVPQTKDDYQVSTLGLHSYQTHYLGDENNSAGQSACRSYAVGVYLRGKVFQDSNSDGDLDSGEAGIRGTKVTLKKGSSVVQSDTTTSNGSFEFFVTAAGSYMLLQTQPAGYESTTADTVTMNITSSTVTAKNFGERAIGPSPSPDQSTAPTVPEQTVPEQTFAPAPSTSDPTNASVTTFLWIGIGLVSLALVALLVLLVITRRSNIDAGEGH